jgi:tetratricopeptide (TPR) repeat protein
MRVGAGLLLVFASLVVTPGWAASDWDVCKDNKAAADVSIAACTRVIRAGKTKGNDLANVYYNRAISYRQKNDDDAALSDYNASIRLNPRYPSAYNNRGNIFKERGDRDRAIADYNEAIRLDPDFAMAYANRGDVWNGKNEPDKALADFDRSIRLDPKYARAYNLRGLAWKNKGDLDRAISDFTAAIRNDPKSATFHANRGDVWDDKGDQAAAIKDLDEAIRINPDYAHAYNLRGVVWKKKGDLDRAISDFSAAIRNNPKSAIFYTNRGDAWDDKGDQTAAIKDLDEAVRIDPDYARAYNIRGFVHGKSGNPDRAIADYTSAIRANPQYAVAYVNRGNVQKNRGELDRAIADYGEALRINPKYDVAHMRRSEAYFRKGDLGAALRDADQAVNLDPKDAANYVNRASLLTESGENTRAITDLNEAIRLQPAHAKALAMRGLAFEKQADRSRALADFAAVLAIAPGRNANDWAYETARTRRAALEGSAPPSLTAPQPAYNLAGGSPAVPTRPDLGRRVALIIGNSAYKAVATLPNPRRDAEAIAASLRRVGFQTVRLEADLGREKLIDALRNFAREADLADWAVVYFAGHGMEIGGTNYLLPVDAKLETDRDVSFEGIPMEQVLNAVEGAKRMRLVLLDACRDNPFASRMRRTNASRSVSRGLSRIEPDSGTLVVYAAKHGETASDGSGSNSPFAEAIVKNIETPGVELRKVFDLVRDDVMEATNRRQQPFTYGSLPGRQDYYFVSR